ARIFAADRTIERGIDSGVDFLKRLFGGEDDLEAVGRVLISAES
ncbi:MAG: hypothetical protein RL702_3183, partial [Pseudomonadota bacterium]